MRKGLRVFWLLIVLLPPGVSRVWAAREIPQSHIKYPVLVSLEGGTTSTGFYVHNSLGNAFFVTAKHTFFEKDTKGAFPVLKAREALLASYPREPEYDHQIFIKLQLDALRRAGHLMVHHSQDVVVAKIGEIDKSGPVVTVRFMEGVVRMASSDSRPEGSILGANLSNIKKFKDIVIGNDVFVFGYPVSLGLKHYPQIDFKKPLLRKGIIAGKNEEKQTVILDCPTYYGDSGGPVIEIEQISLTEKRSWVIGLIAEFVPFDEKWYGIRQFIPSKRIENSGYSVMIPMDSVLELIEEANV